LYKIQFFTWKTTGFSSLLQGHSVAQPVPTNSFKATVKRDITSVADSGFIPDPNFSIPSPGSKRFRTPDSL
jgi:hypothetical protein